MGAKQSTINLKPLASVCSERRKVFAIVAMIVFVAAAGAVTLRAQREIRIPLHAYMPPDFPATVNAVIPTPQYLPAGYELWRIKRIPADGFGTGKTEIEVEYRDPGCWARKIRCRLQVFVSPITQKPFSGTTGRHTEPLSLRIGTRSVQAQYFTDTGIEWPEGGTTVKRDKGLLEAGNFNTLVFPLDEFMIGIRADSEAGVSRAEVVKVAESLTYTAR